MAYPTLEQVTAFIEDQGLTAPSDLEAILDAVILEWDGLTGFTPFLSTGIDEVHYFDVPTADDIVNFRGGFYAITEIKTGVYGTNTGTAIAENVGYLLRPRNAAVEGKPWTSMRLLSGPMAGWTKGQSDYGSIKVTGKRGWQAVPADVFQSIKEETAARAMPEIMQGVGSVSEIKQGPVTIKYDEMMGKAEGWTAKFRSLALKYQREI